MSEPPRRVRVSAPTGRSGPASRNIALPGSPVAEAETVYGHALRRSQLRLALGTLLGFVVAAAVLTGVIALVPDLDRVVVAGIPLPWLLHAFAYYPLIAVFALRFVRGAARNEARFRQLQERE